VEGLKTLVGPKDWAQIYYLAQFLADFSTIPQSGEVASIARRNAEIFMSLANEVLETEKSAYRFVSGELVEITSEQEITEIEEALTKTDGFDGSREHLRTALRLFGNRKNPDYRNAIKGGYFYNRGCLHDLEWREI
jgi:hypothetical protein